MNVKDIIFEGLAYTVMGLLVVFLILVLIMLVIKAMALFSNESKPEETEPLPDKQTPPQALPTVEQSDDTELVAVITAAVAAAMGTNPSGLFIRSYKKIQSGAWNEAGRREALENRF